MELAIQRANASIHQMAQEHAKFSMMATTIVALHIKGNIATFGHVGDSRLYRLTPDGMLHRETEDHSIVEEEVRAGRMTPEQAANHPSKNVISRALGAEQVVEVDMKTIEVEDGTEFLLCTDGITRHVSDNEIRQLLVISNNLEDVCNELKRRCYERGAEDNLTVVVVRVGERLNADERVSELEPTISPETQAAYAPQPNGQPVVAPAQGEGSFIPASRIAFPAPASNADGPEIERGRSGGNATRRGSGAGKFVWLLLILALIAGAFYAGARFRNEFPSSPRMRSRPLRRQSTPRLQNRKNRSCNLKSTRTGRSGSARWLATDIGKELINAGVQNPLDSPNAEFCIFMVAQIC